MTKICNHNFRSLVLLSLWTLGSPHSSASPLAWEIHQAFPTWVEGERFVMFAKVTNGGTETLPLSGDSTLFDVKQIVLIPQWKDREHYHGNALHSHTHPHADAPWKSELDWRDTPLQMLEEFPSRALFPGQSETIGELELRSLMMEYSMPSPHMNGFQLALRLRSDRYAVSNLQYLRFANTPKLNAHPVLQEIEVTGGYKLPLRRISVGNADWLFYNRIRIALVPEGANPKFHKEDAGEVLVVEFEGVVEEPVRADLNQGFPLSGSVRTVPHLHLWRSLTNRSMNQYFGSPGGFYKETGLTLAQARKLKWDGTDPELQANSATNVNPKAPSNGKLTQDKKSEIATDRLNDIKQSVWPWMLGTAVVTGFLLFLKNRRSNV